MGEAFFWGLVAGSSLLLGGTIALLYPLPRELRGLIMGFGAGVLISAVAYELVGDAFETADGFGIVAAGLFAGAGVFFVGDLLIDRLGGSERKDSEGAQAAGSALAIVLGIVLDGVPESAVIGMSLIAGEGVGAAVIVAVFLSNLPEAIAASTRPCLRGRGDPDHARGHDDARGVRAGWEAHRSRHDARLRRRVRDHSARMTSVPQAESKGNPTERTTRIGPTGALSAAPPAS